MRNLVSCHVWCLERQNQDIDYESLGIPEPDLKDIWVPMLIDFNAIVAIKLAPPHDFVGDNMATLYINGEHFTVDIEYEEAIVLWTSGQ